MISYSFYHKDTGAIHPKLFSTDDATQLRANTPADHLPIEGHHDPLSKRVDVTVPPELVDDINRYGCTVGKRTVHKIIDYQPPAPSADHEWNPDTKRWQLSASVQAEQQGRALVLQQIAALESKGIRAMRELALDQPGAKERVAAIDSQIAALRASLQPGRRRGMRNPKWSLA
jgi:hypothetical protein